MENDCSPQLGDASNTKKLRGFVHTNRQEQPSTLCEEEEEEIIFG